MMKRKHILTIFLCCIVAGACREKYVAQLKEPANDFLVVDGFINSGAGPTTISLSRTTAISAPVYRIVRETKAGVWVESKNTGTTVALTETAAGIYTHPQLSLNANDEYRLVIRTSNLKTYASDFSRYRRMPDIDSIPWRQTAEGVEIGLDLHDNALPTGYYQVRFDETWEIHSAFLNYLKRLTKRSAYLDSVQFQPNWSIFTCWKYDSSYNLINVTSTEKLSKNQLSFYPLVNIVYPNEKLNIRYSVFAKVLILSKQGFQFQEQLKKNTELLGSIFDAQPSDNWGNMRCITNPLERVIGFVEVGEEKTKRIFINNNQLKNWNMTISCEAETLEDTSAAVDDRLGQGWMLTSAQKSGQNYIQEVQVAPKICVDCTLKGSNKKPSFW